MKHLLLVLVLLILYHTSFAQRYDSLNNYGIRYKRTSNDTQFNVPFIDTLPPAAVLNRPGALTTRPADTNLYFWRGVNWQVVLTQTSANNLYWRLGGNTLTNTGTFGTISNHQVDFITNNVTRTSFTTAGRWVYTATSAAEDVLSIGNNQANRVFIGTGQGVTQFANSPFISVGSTLTSSNVSLAFGVQTTLSNSSTLAFETPLLTTMTFRGPVQNTTNGDIIRIISRASISGSGITGTVNMLHLDNSDVGGTYQPQSGTNTFTSVYAHPRLNSTNTHTGKMTGFTFDPVIVAASKTDSIKAFEALNADGFGLWQVGARVNNFIGGKLGIGTQAPTAGIQIRGGSAGAGTAPLKINTGTVLTTPEAGAMEFNGTSLFFTPGATRLRTPLTNNAQPVLGQVIRGDATGNYLVDTLVSTSETAITTTSGITLNTTFTNRLVNATGGNITITITPSWVGQKVAFKRRDATANVITIQMASGQIDGAATYVNLNGINSSVTITWFGTNAFIE